jgi:CheY-like chemotaxis protein
MYRFDIVTPKHHQLGKRWPGMMLALQLLGSPGGSAMEVSLATPMVNKRFALIGLTDRDENAVSETLTQLHARAVRISTDTTLVGINTLAPYDACIVDPAMLAGDKITGGITLADLERRQVLALIDESQLIASDFASIHPRWEVIVKPLRSPELVLRLSRLIVSGEQRSLPRPIDATRKALVVDDDQTVRSLLSAILQAAGFKCDCAPNAGDALAALAMGRHDLVMLDLGMPEMDGFNVLKTIRGGHPARNPAVVIVTSATREEDVLRGFGLGADDYVTKPFNPRELIARCQRAIRNRSMTGAEMVRAEPATRAVSVWN